MSSPLWHRARCAITGRFVTLAEALKRPASSIVQKIRRKP